MNEYWEKKLNPYDWELCNMVANLTGFSCEPKNGVDHYFFEVDYSNNPDPQYILAIWDAVVGRAGKRLMSIEDNPDRHAFIVKMYFSDENYPEQISIPVKHRPNLEKGRIYKHDGELFTALQVKSENIGRLLAFVGNGTWIKPKDSPGTFSFENGAGCVYKFVPEGWYIVHISDSFFRAVRPEEFEKEFELT